MNSRLLQDKLMRWGLTLMGYFTIIVLLGILYLLFSNTLKAFVSIPASSFFNIYWNPSAHGEPSYGLLQLLWSSVLVTVVAMAIAIPLGVGVAVFLSEIASRRLRGIIKPIIEILAGVPSVAIGFIGIVLIGPFIAKTFGLSNGFNALNGAILLAFMSLPTIVSVSEDALRSVPQSFREASYALGGNKWVSILKVVLPAAGSGIIAACILGFGRAIGETMTVLMVTGNATAMPDSLFDPVRTLTATIAIELGEVPFDSPHYYALFVLGLLLFIISLFINFLSEWVASKFRYKI
ncbi:MAG TPA: phosphate ABC transporter permease subunit PstC [Flavobacterium sp.]|nr:phosphate ABC transporter permease subunit PstC [Flavobacterium sp.]